MIVDLGQLIADLAHLSDEDYELRRRPLAKELGLRVGFLDEKRRELRVKRPPLSSSTPTLTPGELLDAGREVLEADDSLALYRSVLPNLGYAGPTAAAELVHLAFASRLLDRPLNLALEGPSAGGKTFTVGVVARFHPSCATHDLTACSERALVYSRADFAHTVVIIAEGSALHQDGPGATIVRSIAWGNGIRYETTIKNDSGNFETVIIEKPGPTGLITTTTKPLEAELSTRLLAVPIADNSELTREIIRMQAAEAAGDGMPEIDFEAWIAADEWLAAFGERRVVVPFAPELAEVVPYDDVRLRRDFAQVISIVRTIALIHQRTRKRDGEGRIVASLRDYDDARRLLSDVLSATVDAIPDTTRETVAAVESLLGTQPSGVTVAALTDVLNMSKQGAHRRVRAALRRGYLVNTEERPGRPLQLVLGEPLPPRRVVLPPLYVGNGVDLLTPSLGQVNASTRKPPSSGGEEDFSTLNDALWSEGGRDTVATEDGL